jgi:penicillin-binding protein 1B
MGQSTKTFIKILFFGLLASTFAVIIYVLVVISDIPRHRLRPVSKDREALNAKRAKIYLEKGALIQQDDLDNLILYSSNPLDSDRWKVEKERTGFIKNLNSQKLIEILEDFKLESFYQNDCPLIYCYQHRMPFESIPSLFWKGLMGIEDTRFLDHFGIDFKSIIRAVVVDIIEMKMVQGASTLTQQLVRNLFYSNKKTLTRKLKEIISSLYIELNFSKEVILEAYFNEVFWGALGGIKIRGLYAASSFYFDKKPSEINPFEASILISMLKGPNFYNPIRHLKRIQKRTKVVFRKLVFLSLFPKKFGKAWTQKKWEAWRERLKIKSQNENYHNIWRASLISDNVLTIFEQFVFYQKVSKVKRFVKERSKGKDFAIKAMIGIPLAKKHKILNNKKPELFTYYSKYERKKQTAIQDEKHQIGSTIKPILYRLFLDNGKKLSDFVETTEFELKLKSGNWSPRESHAGIPAAVTLANALATSLNRPVIRIAKEIGFKVIEDALKPRIPNLLSPLSEYPAQLLGSLELSVNDLYKLYEGFILKECSLYQEFKLDEDLDPDIKQFDSVLKLLSDPKITTIRKAVGQHMRNMSFFGKTGTSNNGFDSWFVFYEGKRLGIIWVGLEGNRKIDNEISLYGSNTSFKIFEEFYRDRGKRFNEFSCEKNK